MHAHGNADDYHAWVAAGARGEAGAYEGDGATAGRGASTQAHDWSHVTWQHSGVVSNVHCNPGGGLVLRLYQDHGGAAATSTGAPRQSQQHDTDSLPHGWSKCCDPRTGCVLLSVCLSVFLSVFCLSVCLSSVCLLSVCPCRLLRQFYYAFMCIRACMCVQACMYVYTHTFVYMNTHTFVYMNTHAYMYIKLVKFLVSHTRVYTYVYLHPNTCVYAVTRGREDYYMHISGKTSAERPLDTHDTPRQQAAARGSPLARAKEIVGAKQRLSNMGTDPAERVESVPCISVVMRPAAQDGTLCVERIECEVYVQRPRA